MKPTLLLTGGAGYIGSHTAYVMAQQGYHIIVLDSLVYDQPFNYPWATLIKADYADPLVLNELFSTYSIAGVMHFAASIEVGQSVKDPLTFYDNNVAKTIVLLNAMKKYGVDLIIFSSSCAVYGNPQFLPLSEDHPKNPINPYGRTKLMIELILEDCRVAYGLRYVNLRYFNAAGALPVVGLGEYHEPESHLIPRLIQSALDETIFEIFGTALETPDGSCVRDYLHVLDIAHAHAASFNYLLQGGRSDSFNLGTGKGISVKELINRVNVVTHKQVRVIHGPRRVGDPAQLIANPRKAQTILGWKPCFSNPSTLVQDAYDFMVSCRKGKASNLQVIKREKCKP